LATTKIESTVRYLGIEVDDDALTTAVMTGNLTNTVLSLMDLLSRRHPLLPVDAGRLRRSLHLLFGFFLGCVVGTAAVMLLGDWAWSLPTALAAVAITVR
jgi:uncharacterized membrane protein YoaK (UPF0700 family)